MVGVGWHIQFREQLPVTNDDLWMPLMYGFGKCQGRSAADSEVIAFTSLMESLIDCLNPTSSNIQLSAWDKNDDGKECGW